MTDQSTAAMLPPRSLDQEGGPCRDCADCRHWRPATLAGLRDGSLVAVPREPTEAMLARAGDVIVREYAESDWEEAKDMAEALNPRPIWDAMLAAAGIKA
jgi:hypothetical protein